MILARIKERARRLRLETFALAMALRHPRTPWYARLVIAGCVAYVLTPADFLPDVLPVLGLVDDLVFIPAALALASRCVPSAVLAECRAGAAAGAPSFRFRLPAAWRRRLRAISRPARRS